MVDLGVRPSPLSLSRLGNWIPLASFCIGVCLLHVPLAFAADAALVLITVGLLLSISVSSVEYAIGSLASAFLAAHFLGLADRFLYLRWVVLSFGAAALSVRFLFRWRSGRRHAPSKFASFLALFLVISAGTMVSTPSLQLTFLKLGALTCLFYVAFHAGRQLVETYGPAAPRRLVHGLLAYAGPLIVLSIIVNPAWLEGDRRFSGLLGHPNAWGGVVAIVLPWMACTLFQSRRRFSIGRAAWVLWLALVGYTLLLSGSRSAVFGTLLAIVTFWLIHVNRKLFAAGLLVTVCLGVQVLRDPKVIEQWEDRYIYKSHKTPGGGREVLQSRLAPWAAAKATVYQNPWLGLGFGVTTQKQSRWTVNFRGMGELETGSSFWGSLVQVGALGSSPLFLAILILLVQAGRFIRRIRDPWLTGIYCSIVALTAGSVFEGWLIAPGNFICIYYWIQCFFLNALICRFRPAPARAIPFSELQTAAGWVRGRS